MKVIMKQIKFLLLILVFFFIFIYFKANIVKLRLYQNFNKRNKGFVCFQTNFTDEEIFNPPQRSF